MQIFNEKILKKRMGKLIAAKRKSLHISQEALVEKLDIHVRTVGKIESGNSFVTAEALCKLDEIFNMPVKAFFDIEDPVTVSDQNLHAIVDIIKSGGDDKINYYYNVISAIDKIYNK